MFFSCSQVYHYRRQVLASLRQAARALVNKIERYTKVRTTDPRGKGCKWSTLEINGKINGIRIVASYCKGGRWNTLEISRIGIGREAGNISNSSCSSISGY